MQTLWPRQQGAMQSLFGYVSSGSPSKVLNWNT